MELLRAHREGAGTRGGEGATGRRGEEGRAFPLEGVPPSLNLPLAAFLPPEYVPDDAVRLRLYQRFSAVERDEQLGSLVQEVEDRFGALPEPAQNLVYLTSLRLRAAEAGIRRVEAADGEIILRWDEQLPRHLNLGQLERAVGVPLRRGSNQVRLPRGPDAAWMGHLYTLVEALPSRA